MREEHRGGYRKKLRKPLDVHHRGEDKRKPRKPLVVLQMLLGSIFLSCRFNFCSNVFDSH